MKYLLLIVMSMLIFSCKLTKHSLQDMIESDIISQLENGDLGHLDVLTTKDTLRFELQKDELQVLKSLILDINNHGPDVIKKCMFNPDIQIFLSKNKQDSLRIQFCFTCKIWKFNFRSHEYFGNYDNGKTKLEGYLKELILKRLRHNRHEEGLNELEEILSVNIVNGINSLNDHFVLTTNLSTDSNQKILDLNTIMSIKSLLLDVTNYEQTDYFVPCPFPFTEDITTQPKLDNNSFSLRLKRKCGQVTIVFNGEKLTIDSPLLLSKIYNIL